MADTQPRALEDIWEGDRLDRKEEAELLIAYIESVSALAVKRGNVGSLTISVDAGYGEGKTFFLRRLADHLSLNHPVAFVDAWADDLADEPLTALAATLKEALDPLIEGSSDLRTKWNDWLQTTGRIATIAGFGVAKRLLGLVITSAAVTQFDELASDLGKSSEVAKEELRGIGGRTVDGLEKGLNSVASSDLMRQQIERFKAGRNAISQLISAGAAKARSLGAHQA